MSVIIRNFTIALAVLSVGAGIFADSLLSLFQIQISSTSELRWTLIIGMPILLSVSFIWLNRHYAETMPTKTLHSIALLAIFLIPYLWVVRHAQ